MVYDNSFLDKMVFLRSCCICVSLRTGALIIGIMGIILGAILIAPMSVFLEYHSFYIATFVTTGRDTAKLDDAEVIIGDLTFSIKPHIVIFSGTEDGVLQ